MQLSGTVEYPGVTSRRFVSEVDIIDGWQWSGKCGCLSFGFRSKRIDPLTLAKNKVIEALKVQNGYVALVTDEKPLPKKSDREAVIWLSKQTDSWWTAIRYGQ